MKFTLDPPSGFADSYLDVRFFVEFDRAEKAEVRLFNEAIEQPLEILAVTHGYIVDGTVATIKNAHGIDGFINIFNRDKMNGTFRDYASIALRCELTLYEGNYVSTHQFSTVFYNESKSLDAGVIPFDIQIHNPEINLATNEPLRLSIVSSQDRLYELIFKNDQGSRKCTFEAFAKTGRTDFILPSEVLYSDLEIPTTMRDSSSFDLYWTKFEGLDYSKFMNRKWLKIPGCRISLHGRRMVPEPQARMGPLGDLSSDFVLSDRYFVHTHKDFSGFGAKNFDSIRMKRLTFFYYEVLDMNSFQMKPQDKGSRVQNLLSQAKMQQQADSRQEIKSLGISSHKKFLTTFSPVFEKRSKLPSDSAPEPKKKSKPKTGGCAGCGRKKR